MHINIGHTCSNYLIINVYINLNPKHILNQRCKQYVFLGVIRDHTRIIYIYDLLQIRLMTLFISFNLKSLLAHNRDIYEIKYNTLIYVVLIRRFYFLPNAMMYDESVYIYMHRSKTHFTTYFNIQRKLKYGAKKNHEKK